MRQITIQEFHALTPFRGYPWLHEEREWWISDCGKLLGVVIRDLIDNNWGYVVLGRDSRQVFGCIDAGVSLPKDDASRSLVARMMDHLSSARVTA